MGVELIRNRQTDYATFAADGSDSENIRASGALTRIILRAHVLIGTSTMVSNNYVEGFHRLIDSIKIKGAGGIHYFSLGSHECTQQLHRLNRYDRTVMGTAHGPQVANGSYTDVVWVIHFGSRPRDEYGRDNPFDLSAFIPAFDDSELKLEMDFAASLSMDGGATVDTTYIYITTFQVFGTKLDILAEMARQRVRLPAGAGQANAMIPVSTYMAEAATGTLADFSYEKDVPTGTYLRRIAIASKSDATPNAMADDQITQVALKLPQASQRLIQDDFTALVYTQGSIGSMPEADVGVTGGTMVTAPGMAIMDLRQHADPDYGMNLMPYGPGAVKLGMTVGSYASGDDAYLWYDQVRPYSF